MTTLEKLVFDSITEGVMTQQEHDHILQEIHRDGKIDIHESELLSKLFTAVQDGRLRIVDTEKNSLAAKQQRSQTAAAAAANVKLESVRHQAANITQAVDRAIETGAISQAEHDRVMKMIHADGKIDDAEREQLSRLFAAIQTRRVQVQEGGAQAAPADVLNLRTLAEHKRLSVENDESRAARKHADAPAVPADAAAPTLPAEASHQFASPAADEHSGAMVDDTAGDFSGGDPPSEEFLRSFGRVCMPRDSGKAFLLHNDRLLDIRLDGGAWIKTGSMVGYYGSIRFSREGIFEHGLKKLIKKATTGEGSTLTKATGAGNLYLADAGKKISVIDLRGQALVVSGQNILAFEPSVTWDIVFLKQIAAAVVGGLFNVRLTGSGMAAVTTHFDPIVLRVAPGQPVNTDYHATVAWSGGLAPTIRTDVSGQTLIGRTSGETLQMQFQGDGFVIIQPFEETPSKPE